MKSPRIEYPTRKNAKGGIEYQYKGIWGTTYHLAAAFSRRPCQVQRCIDCGRPLEVNPRSYYILAGKNKGMWLQRKDIRELWDVSDKWIANRKKEIDGVTCIDMSVPIYRAYEKRAENQKKKARIINIKDETVTHKFRGDRVANQFATLRFTA